MLTTERVTHLIPTSGSTGARKLIPFTAGLQQQFNRAIGPWMVDLARQRPGILSGPAYWSITPATPPATNESSKVPVGFADDAAYLGGAKGWLVRAAMAVPNELAHVVDLQEFRFRTLLCLLRQRDLRLMSVWHPSFLTLLLDSLPCFWERILEQLLREKHCRAHELAHADPRQTRTMWPRLQVISCWGDGHAEIPMAELRRRFLGVIVQAKGLLATEAIVTIPFGDAHPVAVNSHFFEFIGGDGNIHLVHELVEGETYEVVITTAGGLWRYRLGDCVQVTGFVRRTPSLRFLARKNNVSDLCGEKLSEGFVARVIQESLSSLRLTPRFCLLAPDENTEGHCYTVYFEGTAPPHFADMIDQALCADPNYAYCRNLQQLLPVRMFAIAGHGYETFANRLAAEGRRIGDIKPTSLSRMSGWSQIFKGEYVEPSQNVITTVSP